MENTVGIIILCLVVCGLYALARASRTVSEANYIPMPEPLEETTQDQQVIDDLDSVRGRKGLRFRILDYSFTKIDLASGPSDPECFYDELRVQFENPANGYTWINTYMVGTPKGIEAFMRSEHWSTIYGDSNVIVLKYDIDAILDTILDRIGDTDDPEDPFSETEKTPAPGPTLV